MRGIRWIYSTLLGLGDRSRLRTALLAKTEKVRQEIGAALPQTGHPSPERNIEIGS